ncbi:MAG: hypothetical protein A2315_04195 [Ignavibacteria bacterium RIFOXYB2_FULL_35_12]|nr:MAG: hypothetical protein A2058_02515 [Ignavibacteria bacterium GWA2_36_19]OGU62773.1 MAG: hypothetical protein A2X60_02455 [Ignavibacteria bacterium GWF2_35_20]OGU77993.1 MAG: hypothetical protein A2254_09085 [Ignavibacteria bacterium RIFOXYA2_FULL_35_9]OGU86001.1 MAG: hypothetical protein A3K31_04550 [Ignavibacteria bacterium RIFOXYA12_FULL_35_25]OGU91041.1 MAG: hypothetical protein A2492_14765 [Ignavibacteria bacterium RIFOXYC12_FULL_35_11]OGU97125.1 MAG: hypothetical protein A2347_16035
MSAFEEMEMEIAPREIARLLYSGVVKSFAKTATEPITNSDTSYKRKLSLPHSSGFVELALQFDKGNKFDTAEIKKRLRKKDLTRFIEIHLYTAKGYKKEPRTCEIIDFAEGVPIEKLRALFKLLAEDKAEVSSWQPGRSLFGRGVSDVLLGHKLGKFYSMYNGVLSLAEFSFDLKRDNKPKIKISPFPKPSAQQIREAHLSKDKNGSCVGFVLNEDCRLPGEGTLIPILSQFYMLRLINFDPNVKIKIFQYRSGQNVLEDELECDFPFGDVIERITFEMISPLKDEGLKNLKVDGIICRSEGNNKLPGREAGEQRANGLLIVDDMDAVLDLTFLPQFEGAPYLSNIFGVIRITNLREHLSWYLNNGKDSPLTVTREGFDTKHDFTKLLFKELAKYLEPIYKKEEERFKKSSTAEVSHEMKEKINEAIKELNRFLKQLGEGIGPGETVTPLTKLEEMQFVPKSTTLTLDQERIVRLYIKKDLVKKGSEIIFDSNNSRINIYPLANKIDEGRMWEEYLLFSLSVKCDSLHETGLITALAESEKGFLETQLEILDVISAVTIAPPDEMEFRPKDTRGQPNKVNYLTLLVNPKQIPLGRKIKLGLIKSHGTIGFLENGAMVDNINITFDKLHLAKDGKIGRISISWRGTGWGQQARIFAETKKPDGTLAHIEGRILTEKEPEDGGMIKNWKYTDQLEDQRCSDLIDGIFYINSKHALNKAVFGTKEEFKIKMDEDKTAQYRFSSLLVEQSVYTIAERKAMESGEKGLIIDSNAPVTSLRKFIDKKTNEFSPKILKIIIKK